jgi:hypothetical protein
LGYRLDKEPEPPPEESEAYQKVRAWRAEERKKMVESMEKLLDQALRMAQSRYTRSAQRAKWTRLAGQLLWYKDQILRAMTYEALEQDMKQAIRDQYKDRQELARSRTKYPIIQPTGPTPFQPTIVKKKQEDEEAQESIYSDSSSKEPMT